MDGGRDVSADFQHDRIRFIGIARSQVSAFNNSIVVRDASGADVIQIIVLENLSALRKEKNGIPAI